MEEKQTKKIKRYLEDVIDGRDDLVEFTEKLINTARLQVQALLKTQVSLSQKEELLRYLTKMIVLFTELNSSILHFLENEPQPNIIGHLEIKKESQKEENPPTIQDLSDYFKANQNESISNFDFSTTTPKVSNSEVVNDSYIRKPLDNTTLKVICSNLLNSKDPVTNSEKICCENASNSVAVEDKELVPAIESNETNNVSLLQNITVNNAIEAIDISTNNTSLIQRHHNENAQTHHVSPTFSSLSESEIFSTVSSVAYQHPLTKFHPPTEIPKQYDTQDIEQIRENLIKLSKKMGFDSERFDQVKSQFNKNIPSLNYEYEEPVKEVQEQKEERSTVVLEIEVPQKISDKQENNTDSASIINTVTEEAITQESTGTDQSENKVMEKLNDLNATEDAAEAQKDQIPDTGPSKNTGAIRKQKCSEEDLIEFSGSVSDSEACDKVSIWLNNNPLAEKKLQGSSESTSAFKTHQNSAVDKLYNIKRYDRNEEARENAINDMPDLKLIPVEVPKVIKNDLGSDNSSTERKNNGGKKKNFKDLNKENGVYELKKIDLPTEGAVCMFSHIVSPSEFYLQIVDDSSSTYLDEVCEKLNEKLKKSDSEFRSKKEAFDKLGKFCYGYVWGERNTWYRLQVLDWELGCPSPDVEVQSVDYGFKCRTSYTYLREMTNELAHVPMLAIQCHFPLVYPPGSTYSNRLTEWPPITVEALYNIAGINQDRHESEFKMFQIIFAMLQEESLAVDLVPFGEPSADSLGSVLVEMGLGTEIIDEYDHAELGEFLEDIDELESPENLNELVLGYDAKDEMRICKFTRKDGTCYKGKNCKLEHITLKDGYTTDKTMTFYTATNDLIFPNKDETLQVLVTTYINSCTYLVQMVRNPANVKDNTNFIMDREISDLVDAMNHPKITSKYEHFKVYPAVGEVILAYHALSRVWMRVAVSELHFDKKGDLMSIDVYSVDFGDQFSVKLKDVRVMKEDFMHVPFQVILIYLDKYQHKIGCDPKKARRFFDKHMSYKNFMAHIKSKDAPYRVSLTTFKGREIGPTLMREGIAEKRSMDIYISESQDDGRKLDLE